ncbi:MAG: NRDE family protein [Holophagaceae bacterium]|nr:NRDE family protein [Holophagaceae bacterium]
MCLIAFFWDPEGEAPLLVAANRDEFYERPTAPMAWWEGGRILAGRDLRAGGTWMGVTREGRFAALTNHRNPQLTKAAASRGGLPSAFLAGSESAAAFLERLRPEADRYNPFNLLLHDGVDLMGYESVTDRLLRLGPGLHAVSNGAFDEPWPKVEALKAGFIAVAAEDAALLGLLAEDRVHDQNRLPSTGISLDLERALSPAFIRTPTYGTRSSTILRLGREAVSALEQRFTPEGASGRSVFQFRRT